MGAKVNIGDAVMAVWLHSKHEPAALELLAIFDGAGMILFTTSPNAA